MCVPARASKIDNNDTCNEFNIHDTHKCLNSLLKRDIQGISTRAEEYCSNEFDEKTNYLLL